MEESSHAEGARPRRRLLEPTHWDSFLALLGREGTSVEEVFAR